jgi:hypothetical protein
VSHAPPEHAPAACDPFDLSPLSDRRELERLAVYGVCAAGRSARAVWPKVVSLLCPEVWWAGLPEPAPPLCPFDVLRLSAGRVACGLLRHPRVRMGQYGRIGRALEGLARLPRAWSWRDLLSVPGVGLKTAKLVQLYDAANALPCACLDVHVLHAMRAWRRVRKVRVAVPVCAPSDPDRYAVLEALFAREAEERGVPCWRLDKDLWSEAPARRTQEGGR